MNQGRRENKKENKKNLLNTNDSTNTTILEKIVAKQLKNLQDKKTLTFS